MKACQLQTTRKYRYACDLENTFINRNGFIA
jgi:hypothetical protein